MTRHVGDINEMRALVTAGGDLSDVVFHYRCTECGKRKKISRIVGDPKQFVGDKTRLDVVLEQNGRCVRCGINAGAVAYKRYEGGDDGDDEPVDDI